MTGRCGAGSGRGPDSYLIVRDACAAIAWYGDVFGARLVGDAYVDDDDRIGHAELDVDGVPPTSPTSPELGLSGPGTAAPPSPCTSRRRRRRGRRPGRSAGRRWSVLRPTPRTAGPASSSTPYGHRWILQAPDGAATPGPRPGDTVYLTLQVPDGARARDFHEAVLGWSIAPGRVADGWEARGVTPMIGIGGGADAPAVVPMYAVDDIEVAVAAVRTAGGEAGETERQSFAVRALPRRPGPAVLARSAGAEPVRPAGRRRARPRGGRCPGPRPCAARRPADRAGRADGGRRRD